MIPREPRRCSRRFAKALPGMSSRRSSRSFQTLTGMKILEETVSWTSFFPNVSFHLKTPFCQGTRPQPLREIAGSAVWAPSLKGRDRNQFAYPGPPQAPPPRFWSPNRDAQWSVGCSLDPCFWNWLSGPPGGSDCPGAPESRTEVSAHTVYK